MNINKKIWWLPIIGMLYIVRMGLKHGFYNNVENLSGKEALLGCFYHAITIVAILYLLIMI